MPRSQARIMKIGPHYIVKYFKGDNGYDLEAIPDMQ